MSMFFSDIGHMHLFFIFSPKKMRDYGTFFPFIFHMSNLSVFVDIMLLFSCIFPFNLIFVEIILLFFCIFKFYLIFVDIILLFFAYVHLPAHKKNQELSLLILLHIFITLQHSMFHLVNFLCQFPDIRINMTGNQYNGTS